MGVDSHGDGAAFVPRVLQKLSQRAERIEFANLADDIRYRVGPNYSVYVNSNDRRIVITEKVDDGSR